MIEALRNELNEAFTPDRYKQVLDELVIDGKYKPLFRVAETPIFIPEDLKDKLLDACERLVDFILSDTFKERSETVLSRIGINVPNEDDRPAFIQMDFGITKGKDGELMPQLIEMQGFPSLYFFQKNLAAAYRSAFDLDESYTNFFSGLDAETYSQKLRELIMGDEAPEHTILLEIDPERQNTAYDFYATAKELGLRVLDLKDLMTEDGNCYYLDGDRKVAVKRIYNRVIFDELTNRTDLNYQFDFDQPVNARWVGHPNWYFRISKYILPFITDNPYVPETRFLSDFKELPAELDQYVLKPLFSFSGTGVVFNVTKADIDNVPDPENWVLQRKVTYHPVIQSPDPAEPVKCEVRMMLIWNENAERPEIVNNIIRLSKGDMIGVKYNKDKDWVGASCAFFKSE